MSLTIANFLCPLTTTPLDFKNACKSDTFSSFCPLSTMLVRPLGGSHRTKKSSVASLRIQHDGYWRFQTEEKLIVAYRCSMVYMYWWLSCPDNSNLIFFLYRATETLHQGQGHRNDHEYIYPMHKSTFMLLSLKALSAIGTLISSFAFMLSLKAIA